jgi:hypothetical protein
MYQTQIKKTCFIAIVQNDVINNLLYNENNDSLSSIYEGK